MTVVGTIVDRIEWVHIPSIKGREIPYRLFPPKGGRVRVDKSLIYAAGSDGRLRKPFERKRERERTTMSWKVSTRYFVSVC